MYLLSAPVLVALIFHIITVVICVFYIFKQKEVLGGVVGSLSSLAAFVILLDSTDVGRKENQVLKEDNERITTRYRFEIDSLNKEKNILIANLRKCQMLEEDNRSGSNSSPELSPTRTSPNVGTIKNSAGGTSILQQGSNNQAAGNNSVVVKADNGANVTVTSEKVPVFEQVLAVNEYVRFPHLIRRGQHVRLNPSGSISLGPWVGVQGPAGAGWGTFLDHYSLQHDIRHGALMYRIGANSRWVPCDREMEFTASTGGELEFEVNDNDKDNNKGAFKVEVRVYN